MQGHVVVLKRYRATPGERNFLEQIIPPIFLEAVLAIEILREPKLNLEEKDNPWTLEGNFC